MKKLLIPILLFSACQRVNAQADPYHNASGGTKTPVTRTIESFGAIANDGIDDSKAFSDAAEWFSNKGATNVDYATQYGVLNIGIGTYIVGEQGTSVNGSDISPRYATNFENIDGLIIQGAGVNLTKVKTKPGAYWGYFDKADASLNTPMYGKMPNVDSNVRNPDALNAYTGMTFTLFRTSRNILIRDMEMDGSSNTFHVGYPWSANGDFVTFSYGVYVGWASYVSLENLYIHNFGEDGIMLHAADVAATAGRWNLTMDSVRSFWNGRQALSWVDGRDVKIENSTFAYTRLQEGSYDTDPNPVLSPTAGSPGLNIDIEPEGENSMLRNGIFNNCSIIGNPGPSGSLAIQLNTDSVTFNNCEIAPQVNSNFQAIGLQTLWHRNITFNGCQIKGTIDFHRIPGSQQTLNPDGFTKFNNCSIEGCSVPGLAAEYLGLSLIAAYDRVQFNNCTIKQVNKRPLFQILNASLNHNDIPSPDNYVSLNNCTLQVSNTDAGFLDRMYGLRFTGNTTWTQPAATAFTNRHFQNITINGSSMYSPMQSFTFPNTNLFLGYMGSSDFYSIPAFDVHTADRPIIMGETPCEYLNVYLGDLTGNSAIRNDERPMYIGEGTTLTVRKGSALILSGNIYLAGKIVVEAGAYFCYGTSYLQNDAYGNYPANTGPTIHYLGSTSPASHIIINPGAILSPPPYVWVLGTAAPLYVPHSLRSELMAPNQYLRSAVVANRANYDDASIKCQQCLFNQSANMLECLSSRTVKLHPLNGIADADFYFPSSDDSDIEIYPNPTNDKVNISLNGVNKASDVQLLDINGRLLYRTTSKEGSEVEISLSKYPQGTYLVRISNENNTVVKKVVKVN